MTARERNAIDVRYGANGYGVVTIEGGHGHQTQPCAQCPWRRDAPVGRFPPEVYRLSAPTAYDLADRVFGCHMSPADQTLTCAGFLLAGADHNLTVRMARSRYADVHSDVELYDSYREMAEANGVDPGDPVLAPCRSYDD